MSMALVERVSPTRRRLVVGQTFFDPDEATVLAIASGDMAALRSDELILRIKPPCCASVASGAAKSSRSKAGAVAMLDNRLRGADLRSP